MVLGPGRHPVSSCDLAYFDAAIAAIVLGHQLVEQGADLLACLAVAAAGKPLHLIRKGIAGCRLSRSSRRAFTCKAVRLRGRLLRDQLRLYCLYTFRLCAGELSLHTSGHGVFECLSAKQGGQLRQGHGLFGRVNHCFYLASQTHLELKSLTAKGKRRLGLSYRSAALLSEPGSFG